MNLSTFWDVSNTLIAIGALSLSGIALWSARARPEPGFEFWTNSGSKRFVGDDGSAIQTGVVVKNFGAVQFKIEGVRALEGSPKIFSEDGERDSFGGTIPFAIELKRNELRKMDLLVEPGNSASIILAHEPAPLIVEIVLRWGDRKRTEKHRVSIPIQ